MTTTAREVQAIPVDAIHAGPNDRHDFDAAGLLELAESIRVHGLAQPITVRPVEGRHEIRHEIVAGERRWRAHQLLGFPTIDAIVRELDDETASALMLIENLQRADLNPMEEAEAYRSRIDRFGLTVEQVAEKAGVEASRVRWRLELLNLVPEAQHLCRVGQLKRDYAWRMSRLDANRQRLVLAALAHDDRMSWEDVKALCDRLGDEQAQDVMFDTDDFLRVEEWVAEVRGARRGPKTLIAELVSAVERTGWLTGVGSAERALVDEARAWLEGTR